MIERLLDSPYLWVSITAGFFVIAAELQKRFPTPLLNPLLFSIVMVIVLLLITDIPYETYESGGVS